MALVTTTVTPEVRLTPFTGLSETVRERSGIARAEVVYSALGTWPATAAGDNRSISFAWSLDPDYGYVMMDSNASFILYNDGRKKIYPITGSNSIMAFTMNVKPSALLYPFPGVNTIDCTAMFGESQTEEASLAYRFYTRFLQYDITQGYHFAVQSPALTR
jgi:hypothetical protein